MDKRYLILGAVLAFMAVTACRREALVNDSFDQINTIRYELSEKIDQPIVFLGTSANGFIGESIADRSYSVVGTASDARILVVNSSEMDANREILKKAFSDGKVIVELEPDNASHCAFWNYVGAPSYLDANTPENDLILLAVRGYSCYQLENPYLDGVFQVKDCTGEDYDESDTSLDPDGDPNLGNYTAEPVAVGKTVDFFSTKLNSFAEWVDKDWAPVVYGDKPVPSFDGDLSKRITDASLCQHITKTYNVGADNFEFAHVILSSADKVSRHSTVDVSIYIAPLYSYSVNGTDTSGDYYFVTMSVISHNKPMYDTFHASHGAVKTYAHIFYSKNITWDATLVNSDRSSLGSRVSFFETPKPTSTANSTSYTSGFSKTLNVSGQGGISGGAPTVTFTVGGSFTWSNSQSTTIQDQSIEMSTDPSLRSVHYDFQTNNDQMEDNTKKAIPAIARTDQICDASWCWHVSDTKDDDLTTHFTLKFELNPFYGYMYRHATWKHEGHRKSANLLKESDRVSYFDIVVPNRKRNGIIEIKSTNSEYMYGLKIKDLSGKIIAQDDGAYERNNIQRYQIPVGRYNVEYEIRNGDTGESKGFYRISDVEISVAQTTTRTTIDGKKIQ